MFRRPNALALPALLCLVLSACRSAEGYKEDADREVYELVKSRRSALGAGDESFTIEPDPDSLRQRLLRGEPVATEPLTLVQCLEIAAENSREFQARKESLYLAALDLTLERWNFAVHKTGVLSASVEGTGDTAETASADGTLALSKLLGSGALILGDIGLGLSRSLTTGDSWNPISDLGLAVTQPLLRGAGSDIVKEDLTQAERDLVYEARSFERFRRTFAFDVADRFYAVLEARDAVVNQQTNYDNLVALALRNSALSEAGRIDDIETGQARQNELRSRDNLLQVTSRYEGQMDEFRIFLGLPPDVPVTFDQGELERLAGLDLAPIEVPEETAKAYALEKRLDHLNAVDRSVDSERKVHVAEDALRAGLLLAAEWDAASEAGEPGEISFQDSTWSISAVLDLPIDRLPERNAYRAALINREVSRRAAELSADAIVADLRADLRDTRSGLESWQIQQNAVELAERRIESIELRMQAGRAGTRDLLEAQEALLQARNSTSSSLIDYNLSRLAFFRDMELLRVDESGFHVEPFQPAPSGAAQAAPSAEPAEPIPSEVGA